MLWAQDQANAALSDYKKKLNEKISVLERGEDKIARLMEERNSLKRKVERLSTKGSVDALLEEEVASLKVSPSRTSAWVWASSLTNSPPSVAGLSLSAQKMMRCPVCNDNMKDTVITRCFHVFCGPCVKSRLQLRNR